MDCSDCGKKVEAVALALASKIVGPHCSEFRCLGCLARRFGTTEESLLAVARRYRERGCPAFAGLHV